LEITYELFDNEHRESVSGTNMITGKACVLKNPPLWLYSNNSGGSSADSTLSPNSSHSFILGKSRVRTEPINVMSSLDPGHYS